MKLKHYIRIFISVLLTVIITACQTVPAGPDRNKPLSREDGIGYLTAFIEHKMNAARVPGVAVALVDKDGIIWSRGFGFADKPKGIAVTDRTVFEVGSISKVITATALMQLVQQGLIDLDLPVKTYIPEFEVLSRFSGQPEITPRMLMTHHSGLQTDISYGMWGKKYKSLNDFHDIVPYLKNKHVAYRPDYIFSYSNIGIDLLGIIIERVSGLGFSEYIEQNIFNPLKMDTASFEPISLRRDLPAGLASHGHVRGGKKSFRGLVFRDIPAGTLNCSVLDLCRFIRMVLNKGSLDGQKILDRETLAMMLVPQNEDIALDLDFKIGLNYFLTDNRLALAGSYCGHGGDMIFYHASMDILSDLNLGVIVMTNSPDGKELASDLSAEILKTAMHMEHSMPYPEVQETVAEKVSLTEAELEFYRGDYITSAGLIKIIRKGDKLSTVWAGKKLQIEAFAGGWFKAKYKLLGIIPVSVGQLKDFWFAVKTISGMDVLIVKSNGNKLVYGVKIKPEIIPEAWNRRTGEYKIMNGIPGQNYDDFKPVIYLNDGYLCFSTYKGRDEIVLKPVSDNEAIVAGLGRGHGQTIYIKTIDGQECLEFSGWLLAKKISAE